MTITMVVGNQIPNYPKAWQVLKKPSPQYQNASKGIHRLEYEDLWGGIGTILTEGGTAQGGIRIDRQNPLAGGGANVQVQLNGFTGHTSVAHVLINASLNGCTDAARRAAVISKVKAAFFQSLNHGTTMTVQGNP